MVCPKCKCEAMIKKQRMVFRQEENKLYRVLTYTCRNKKCDRYEKEVGEVSNEVDFATE